MRARVTPHRLTMLQQFIGINCGCARVDHRANQHYAFKRTYSTSKYCLHNLCFFLDVFPLKKNRVKENVPISCRHTCSPSRSCNVARGPPFISPNPSHHNAPFSPLPTRIHTRARSLWFAYGITGSHRTSKYSFPFFTNVSFVIGRKKVNGGNSISPSPG